MVQNEHFFLHLVQITLMVNVFNILCWSTRWDERTKDSISEEAGWWEAECSTKFSGVDRQ